MVRKISVSDITMKESGANGHSLSFREKIELSKLLDKLGVSVIETNPIVNRKPDSLLVKSMILDWRYSGMFMTEGARYEQMPDRIVLEKTALRILKQVLEITK